MLLLRRSLLQLGADGGTPEALAAVLVLADQGKHAPAVFEGREGKGGKGQQLLQRRVSFVLARSMKSRDTSAMKMRPRFGLLGLHRLLQLAQQPCSLCFYLVGGEGLAQPLLVPRLCEKQIRQAGM